MTMTMLSNFGHQCSGDIDHVETPSPAQLYDHVFSSLTISQDELGDYEDDYYIIDCPGQIELCTPPPTPPLSLSVTSIAQLFSRIRNAGYRRQAAANGHACVRGVSHRLSSALAAVLIKHANHHHVACAINHPPQFAVDASKFLSACMQVLAPPPFTYF
jgi:hypothetical protein